MNETDHDRARVLVVEDEESILRSLVRLLRVRNYVALGADSAKAAFDTMESAPPDLAILDMYLEGWVHSRQMDGLEVCRKMKSNPKTAGIPVIMFTAYGDPQHVRAAIDAGAVDFVVKPYSVDALFSKIQKHLGPAWVGSRKKAAQILVVGDDISTRTHTMSILSKAGYLMESAADGRQAMDKILKTGPQVAVIDLKISGSANGVDICRQILQDPTLAGVCPLLMVSPSDKAEPE